MKQCDNCVNCEKIKRPDGSEFWACDEYGAVYLGVPADVTPPGNDACDLWTDDPKRKNKNLNAIMRLL